MKSWHLGVVASLAVAGLSGASSGGCGGGGSTGDAGYDAGPTVLTCQDDPRVTAYATGVTTPADGGIIVTFLSSNPDPPGEYVNAWSVKVTDASGNPIEGQPVSVNLYMPDMYHGANNPWVDGGAGGIYEISEANLFMPGIWRVTVEVNGPTGQTAQIDFCITG